MENSAEAGSKYWGRGSLGLGLALWLLLLSSGATAGDPRRGEALFVGTVAMAEGGAPCLGCHSLGGVGLGRAAGASYGPDLTELSANFGADGIAAILEDLTAFPSMAPIYAERPLTIEEQAELGAFLVAVAGSAAPEIGRSLAGHVVVGLLLFFVVVGLLGWRRLQGARRPLVERAKAQEGRVA